MAKLRLEVELDYDADIMHGNDADAISWFRNDILLGKGEALRLHSDEIGDVVGEVTVVRILEGKALAPASREGASNDL